MKSSTMRTALGALVWMATAGYVAATPAMVAKGCYKTWSGLKDQGPYLYQSTGYCHDNVCVAGNYTVMALWKGSDCLCGNELPPDSDKVPDSECNVPCQGYNIDTCGGQNTYSVFLTGIEADVPVAGHPKPHPTTDAGGSSSSTGSPSVVTEAGPTIYKTQGASAAASGSSSQGSGGPNTAAIAAGVVVGIAGLTALAAAAFFFVRHRQNRERKEVEAEYRRSAALNTYKAAPPMATNPTSDSRFDGTYMAQRRQSNGSIDDDQDFSRRILQVTNPDR